MKVFVTNLPTSAERRESMLKQLIGSGLDYEFVHCVIGNELSEEEIAAACDLKALRRLPWIGRGMIGATMTSQNIYREIIKRDLKCGMLLEDDTVLPSDLKFILDRCEAFIEQGDVILLFWLSSEELVVDNSTRVDLGPLTLYRAPANQRVTAGAATIFSKEVVGKLLDFNTPIRMSPDCWLDFMQAGCINRLWIAYPTVIDTADMMSTLEDGPIYRARRFINDHRIFPFYQLLRSKRQRSKTKRQLIRLV